MTIEELTNQRCDCSPECLCNLSHEQGGCDGQNCDCWCHKAGPQWTERVMNIIRGASKEVKGGDGEETEK